MQGMQSGTQSNHGRSHTGGASTVVTEVFRFIGVLDIFGFEIFVRNSFEQLCINYCNEKLQALFNDHTFRQEELVYRQEGVKFPPINFVDNGPVVSAIDGSGGLFALLDDTSRGPGKPETKDAKLSQLIDSKFSASEVVVQSNLHKNIDYLAFSLKHYAGNVCYDLTGFVEKNNDMLFPDLYNLMTTSKLPLLAKLFPDAAAQAAADLASNNSNSGGGSSGGGGGGGAKKKRLTLALQFKSQMRKLMSTLSVCEPHYIRCIKPNSNKAAGEFMGQVYIYLYILIYT
jgi:myosin heavy subunit